MTPIERLENLPYAFHCGKGRVRPNEPMWCVALFRVAADGLSETSKFAFMIEADSLEECVTAAESWAEKHA